MLLRVQLLEPHYFSVSGVIYEPTQAKRVSDEPLEVFDPPVPLRLQTEKQ